MFHLGWFVGRGFGLPTWGRTWTGNVDVRDWLSGQYFVDWARSLERAGFDFIMFADTAYVPDTYGGSAEAYLRNGHMTPMHDPAALIPVLGYTTRHIGLVSTLSTSFYHPYGLARLAGTLDNMTGGRFGWNIVTTSSHQAAACFGVDLPEHDARYDIADEFVELAERLWASWEPDSVVADEKAGMYVDHTKVRPVDFVGRYYRSTGPLNIQPPPQGRPVYVQAGGSTRGIRFAATHAEAIVCMAKGVDNMKRYRDDVRAHAAAAGRDPDTVKVLFLLDPVMGETRHEVEARIEIRIEAGQKASTASSRWPATRRPVASTSRTSTSTSRSSTTGGRMGTSLFSSRCSPSGPRSATCCRRWTCPSWTSPARPTRSPARCPR